MAPNPSQSLADAVMQAYERADWDEAIRLSDQLVESDPRSANGWQMRAIARTFALRYEEALVAYDDAIRELLRIFEPDDAFVGSDPFAMLFFNRSCVLARLGRREDALDALRRAARLDGAYGGKARRDDWWAPYHADPELVGIAAQEESALVFAESEQWRQVDSTSRRLRAWHIVWRAVATLASPEVATHRSDLMRSVRAAVRPGDEFASSAEARDALHEAIAMVPADSFLTTIVREVLAWPDVSARVTP